jgi:isocitrate/isopropylmalate dehydrogenase
MNPERKRVVVIEGEDAAPEAMRPTVDVIDALGLPLEWIRPSVGALGLSEHGDTFPEAARESIDSADATLFGSTSGASAKALFYLRWGKETYANVRPARFIPGCRSPLARPEEVDLVIVRENLEDLYLGLEGDIADLAPLALESRHSRRRISDYAPARYAIKVISEAGSRRVIEYAFGLARERKSAGHLGRVTCAAKFNMLPKTDGYFREIAEDVARANPDIEFDSYIIDDFGQRLVTQPAALDVVVMPNLYGDIFSDTAAGLVGGLGLAPSGCYGTDYAYFESAHGTAPDIAGRNAINPTATLLSAAMMLDYLGFSDASNRLTGAVEAVYAGGQQLPADQGGSASTTDFCNAVRRALGP